MVTILLSNSDFSSLKGRWFSVEVSWTWNSGTVSMDEMPCFSANTSRQQS